MKTKSLRSHFLNSPKSSINQQSLQCERRLLPSLCSWLWLWAHGLSMRVRTNQLNQVFVRVVRGQAAGLVALALLTLSQANRRILIGVGFMGVVAPLSACLYMLFDWRVDKVAGWYHDNYFHFFLLLAPYFCLMFCLIGVWFLFPYRSKRAYALTIPAGVTMGKILWLSLVTSNTEFYSFVPASFIFYGGLISVFLFISLDWLSHRKFHREDAFKARMNKLCELADDFEDSKFKSMVKNVWREEKQFLKQY